jgi:DNA adenine methylase
VKGQELLYANYYGPHDHAEVATLVQSIRQPWVVSYDDHADVRSLYKGCQAIAYEIAYSAAGRYRGREVAFFSNDLLLPEISDPARLSQQDMVTYLRGR